MLCSICGNKIKRRIPVKVLMFKSGKVLEIFDIQKKLLCSICGDYLKNSFLLLNDEKDPIFDW